MTNTRKNYLKQLEKRMILKKFYDTLLLYQKVFVTNVAGTGFRLKEPSSDMKKDVTKKKPKGPSFADDHQKFIKSYSRNIIKTQLLTPLEKVERIAGDSDRPLFDRRLGGSSGRKSSSAWGPYPSNDPLFFTRLSSSLSGKAIVQISLVHHKIPISLALWPGKKNFRYKSKQGILTEEQIKNKRRLNIETLIVGLLSAKASESFIVTNTNKKNILLYKTKKKLRSQRLKRQNPQVSPEPSDDPSHPGYYSKAKCISISRFSGCLICHDHVVVKEEETEKTEKDNTKIRFSPLSSMHIACPNKENQTRLIQDSNYVFGLEVEELSNVTLVTTFLVNTCNFYTKQIFSRKLNKFVSNIDINSVDISEKENLAFLEELNFEMENRFPFRSTSKVYELKAFSNAPRAYWQDKISQELGFNNANFFDWYRIFMADPAEKSSNIEWVAPDDYYLNNPIKIVRNSSGDQRSGFSFGSLDSLESRSYEFENWLCGYRISDPYEAKQRANQRNISSLAPKKLYPSTKPQQERAYLKVLQKNIKIPGKPPFSEPKLSWSGNQEVGPMDHSQNVVLDNLSKKEQNQTTIFITDDQNLVSSNNLSSKTIKGGPLINKWKDNKTLYSKPVCWNNLDQLDHDFLYHTILLRCFNEAFCVIDENRELLDLIADSLLRFELLRQPKLLKVTELFLN